MGSHYDVVHPGETHPNFRFTVVKGLEQLWNARYARQSESKPEGQF